MRNIRNTTRTTQSDPYTHPFRCDTLHSPNKITPHLPPPAFCRTAFRQSNHSIRDGNVDRQSSISSITASVSPFRLRVPTLFKPCQCQCPCPCSCSIPLPHPRPLQTPLNPNPRHHPSTLLPLRPSSLLLLLSPIPLLLTAIILLPLPPNPKTNKIYEQKANLDLVYGVPVDQTNKEGRYHRKVRD